MQVAQVSAPAAELALDVRFYAHLQGELGGESLDHPVPARATPLLEFQFGSTNEVHWCERPRVEASQRVQVVGLQTHRRVRLRFTGTVDTFMIFFQPAGLSRMFAVPMSEITNRALEARPVLGAGVDELADRLREGRSFEERVRIANVYLARQCRNLPAPGRVAQAGMSILHRRGRIRVPQLAEQSCMSARQFERRFAHEIGLSPKLYARIARFESALESKALSSHESWTEITSRLGYFDQMHLIRDFKEFSGEVPTTLIAQLEAAYGTYLEELRAGRTPRSQNTAPKLIL